MAAAIGMPSPLADLLAGTKLDLIERITRDDAEVLELFREVTTGKAGRPAKTITDNISNKATAGTSRSYVLSRLKRSNPKLFAKVVADDGGCGTAFRTWRSQPTPELGPWRAGSALTHCGGARIAMGSGFWAQIVLMPQSLPCGSDRILDAHQISAFSGEDVNRPVRVKHSIDLVRYLNIGHILASGEAADFLECYALQLMSINERFGHRAGSLESINPELHPPCSNTPGLNWGGPALVPPQKKNPPA